MIKSMTGYGRNISHLNGRDVLVEIKSVNHRYFDFSAKLPRGYGYLEEKLKKYISSKVGRGKVEVFVSFFNFDEVSDKIEVNLPVVSSYIEALTEANKTLKLKKDLSISKISRLPDVFSVKRKIEDEEVVWADVKIVADGAVTKFVEMRASEGERMLEDFNNRISFIEEKNSFIESQSDVLTEKYKTRLFTRLKDILDDKNVEEQRILFEAAVFSEKTAVDEETVRLKSHIGQFRELISLDEPVGRKLDFLVQEINREINTIGSKIQDIEVTKIVVDLKSELEKIREQIQNIE